jgi:cytolysin (calcineurin-like family phosphatase)
MFSRRRFVRDTAITALSAGGMVASSARSSGLDATESRISFFIVGDTHYCVDANDSKTLAGNSVQYNSQLVDQLNQLPGTLFPVEVGGGTISKPQGVIHVGDIVDNGDKGAAKYFMAEIEGAAFAAEWGLNGKEGKLNWPVREVHGNHDSPHGDGPMITMIRERNQRREGVVNISENKLHYSWDWGDVHFVALGIVVGDAPQIQRKRRYAPLGSLPFLADDLQTHVGNSGRPVVLVNHVDVHRYSYAVPDAKVLQNEWDYGDAFAFYETIKPYRIAATLCGHTHVRKIARWNGTKDDRVTDGVPFLNTDNAAHFSNPAQAFLHVEIDKSDMTVREFGTKDGWKTGSWTPQVWKFNLAA